MIHSEKGDNRQPLLSRLYRLTTYQQLQKQQQSLAEKLRQRIKRRKQNQKVVIGNETTFNMAQFFKFKKKQQQSESIIDQISGSYWAWIVLLYAVVNNALIQPWTISIGADKFLRLSWRHLLLNLILIPFILYEKRNLTNQKKYLYEAKNIFNVDNLKSAYLVALSKTFWLVVVLTTYQFTQIGHALLLGSLMNFFLSFFRLKGSNVHYLQPGGQIFVLIGIGFILKDQSWMITDNIDPNYRLKRYASHNSWIRVIADVAALIASFIMAITYKFTTNLNKIYPSYLGMLIVNFMITVNMAVSSYFLHGATFDFDEANGIFGILASEHFVNFFYMSVVLGLGMFWSFSMISNLFPEPLLPSLVTLFQPVLSVVFMDFLYIQQLPDGYTFVGYLFILPGMFLILVGQYLFGKIQKAEQKKEQQFLKQLVLLKNQRLQFQQSLKQIPFPESPPAPPFLKSTESKQFSILEELDKNDSKHMSKKLQSHLSWIEAKKSLKLFNSSDSQEEQKSLDMTTKTQVQMSQFKKKSDFKEESYYSHI